MKWFMSYHVLLENQSTRALPKIILVKTSNIIREAIRVQDRYPTLQTVYSSLSCFHPFTLHLIILKVLQNCVCPWSEDCMYSHCAYFIQKNQLGCRKGSMHSFHVHVLFMHLVAAVCEMLVPSIVLMCIINNHIQISLKMSFHFRNLITLFPCTYSSPKKC